MIADRLKIVVVGAGSMEHGPGVFATLAHWNAEVPLDIWLWDADEEMLEIQYLLAQTCIFATQSTHRLYPTLEAVEAFEHADAAIVCLNGRSAGKYLRGDPDPAAVLQRLELLLPERTASCTVIEAGFPNSASIGLPGFDVRIAHGLQVLRWIHGEDSIWDLLNPYQSNALRDWLNEARISKPAG